MGSETRRRRRPSRWPFWLVIAMLHSAVAHGAPTAAERDKARALMEQGDASFDEGEYVAALEAYREADAIMKVPTTGLAVAQALAAMGQVVEAREAASKVVRIPVAAGEPAPFTAARDEAQKLLEELARRPSAILVSVRGPTDPSTIRVELDGVTIPAALLTQPRATTAGSHVVRATAPGYDDHRETVTVESGSTLSVILALQPTQAAVQKAGRDPPAERSPVFWNGQRVTAVVGAGVGTAGALVATIMAFNGKAKYDSVSAGCTPGCDEGSYNVRTAARAQGDVATILFGVSAALLAGSGVAWFTAPRSDAKPRVAIGSEGVAVWGSF
jgi:hypothetical protein